MDAPIAILQFLVEKAYRPPFAELIRYFPTDDDGLRFRNIYAKVN